MTNSIDKKVESTTHIEKIPFYKRVRLYLEYVSTAIKYNKEYDMNLPLLGIRRKRAKAHIA